MIARAKNCSWKQSVGTVSPKTLEAFWKNVCKRQTYDINMRYQVKFSSVSPPEIHG